MRGVLAEAAGDFAGVVNAAVDHRGGINTLFEDNGHLVTFILFGERAETFRGFRGKRKVHLILTGTVGTAIFRGAAQVAAGYDRSAVEKVPAFAFRGARVGLRGCATGYQFRAGGKNAAMLLQGIGFRSVNGGVFDELEL